MYANPTGRRGRLARQLGDAVALIGAAREVSRNGDNTYPFRQDSSFYYLTGFNEPEALALVDGRSGKSVLFCRARDEDAERWTGERVGPQGAIESYGFDEAYPIAELAERLPALLDGVACVAWPVGRDAALDATVNAALAVLRDNEPRGRRAPARFADLAAILDEMRLIKDAAELSLLRRAGRISADAHIAAMHAARPGRYEYELEAELLATFCRHGARTPAYESIVAGGARACTLHYTANNARLADGELVLIDAGCELGGYAGDITRTFPVNGRFSGAQRDVYEIVLAAQLAAIDAVRPGVPLSAPADAALACLARGLIDLKLLDGTVDGAIESGAYKRYYMHGVGHYIGLDVHDVGSRRQDGEWRRFEPGMCTTIEPGLYINAADDVPAALAGIGVRIEDNVLVTAAGREVYTDAVPKAVADIEALMGMR